MTQTASVEILKCERIKEIVDNYLSKNPNHSLQNICNKTEVKYSTLRRIVNLDGNPDLETSSKIFNGLGEDSKLYDYLSVFHPTMADTVAILKNHLNDEFDLRSEEERTNLLNEENHILLSLALTEEGTNEEEVLYYLGKNSLNKLNKFIEKGLLIKNKNGQIKSSCPNGRLTLFEAKRVLELSMKSYIPSNENGIGSHLSYQTASLSKKGLIILKLFNYRQSQEKREFILRNKELFGPHKVFNATISSTFLPYKELEEPELKAFVNEFIENEKNENMKTTIEEYNFKITKEIEKKLKLSIVIALTFISFNRTSYAKNTLDFIELKNSQKVNSRQINNIIFSESNNQLRSLNLIELKNGKIIYSDEVKSIQYKNEVISKSGTDVEG